MASVYYALDQDLYMQLYPLGDVLEIGGTTITSLEQFLGKDEGAKWRGGHLIDIVVQKGEAVYVPSGYVVSWSCIPIGPARELQTPGGTLGVFLTPTESLKTTLNNDLAQTLEKHYEKSIEGKNQTSGRT